MGNSSNIPSTGTKLHKKHPTTTSGLLSWSLDLNISSIQFTVLIFSTLLLISTPGEGNRTPGHRCYVCLPQDKTSSTSQDIISTFPGQRLGDCSTFTTHNAHQFQVDCPPDHVGCQLRINGSQISRTCSQHPVNDCKTANSVEFCYCATSLCNRDHPARQSKHHGEESRLPREDETDDEDLIQSFSHHEGSGYGELEHEHDHDHDHESPETPKPVATTDKSSPTNHGEEDPHLKHNVIPEENKSKSENTVVETPAVSNAMRKVNVNTNQFLISIFSSVLPCFLVKCQQSLYY